MARPSTDREDLMAEAVALARRIEFAVPDCEESVVCGFRSGGGLSVYFGQDPVFHFDAECRLRRAFRGGRLFRTQGDTLAELTRVRTDSETTLRRRDLTRVERDQFLFEVRNVLQSLAVHLRDGNANVLRRVPEADEKLAGDVERFLSRVVLAGPALAPAIVP